MARQLGLQAAAVEEDETGISSEAAGVADAIYRGRVGLDGQAPRLRDIKRGVIQSAEIDPNESARFQSGEITNGEWSRRLHPTQAVMEPTAGKNHGRRFKDFIAEALPQAGVQVLSQVELALGCVGVRKSMEGIQIGSDGWPGIAVNPEQVQGWNALGGQVPGREVRGG